ncbi:MAG: hypothetical protein ACJAZP_002424 [Psychromonas sp.]|jgi:hypothetical protein
MKLLEKKLTLSFTVQVHPLYWGKQKNHKQVCGFLTG